MRSDMAYVPQVKQSLVNKAIEICEGRLPGVVEALCALAEGGMVECPGCGLRFRHPAGGHFPAQQYLMDRLMGKPVMRVESQSVTVQLSADDYAVLARAAVIEARVREEREKAVGGEERV